MKLIPNFCAPETRERLKEFNRKSPEEQLKEFYDIMTKNMTKSQIAEFDKEFQEISEEYLKEKSQLRDHEDQT